MKGRGGSLTPSSSFMLIPTLRILPSVFSSNEDTNNYKNSNTPYNAYSTVTMTMSLRVFTHRTVPRVTDPQTKLTNLGQKCTPVACCRLRSPSPFNTIIVQLTLILLTHEG